MSEGEGRMNKMYQRLKRKCISLVLFALLVAFIVPYYAYAADNGAEPAASAAESTGDFSMSESETSESETSKREETESSEEEEQQTREDADASASTEADVQ